MVSQIIELRRQHLQAELARVAAMINAAYQHTTAETAAVHHNSTSANRTSAKQAESAS